MPAKRIYRNQRDKVVGGVCSGIGDYFDIDVAWVRLAFVLSVFASGFGILAYVIAWIVFPRDERSPSEVESARAKLDAAREPKEEAEKRKKAISSGSRNAVGVLLIGLGILFFMDQNFWWFRFDAFWPIILIGLGVYMLVRSSGDTETESVETTLVSASASSSGSAPMVDATNREATESDSDSEGTRDA
jgi:phage shock protein PspC (stress-responsive transcriptional regulator)